jgi:hypothetical protein
VAALHPVRRTVRLVLPSPSAVPSPWAVRTARR